MERKISLIQEIATQANTTFKTCNGSTTEGNKVFLDNLSQLVVAVSKIGAADLNITPRKGKASDQKRDPSVTYMHVYENDVFTIGIFILKRGAAIPLHDHPGMTGIVKVLYGKIRVRSYDLLESNEDAEKNDNVSQFDPSLTASQIKRAVLQSTTEYSVDTAPCVLTPTKNNLHQVDAVDGPVAILDILAPPYDPDDGRDCHYYRVVQTVADTDKTQEARGEELPGETWLLEIPQPEDFCCAGELYPGPKVSL